MTKLINQQLKQTNVLKKIEKLPHLTGMRFIAAFAVLIFHSFSLTDQTFKALNDQFWFSLFSKVFSKGHLGVSFFFVLSGFLITRILLHEIELNGKINLKRFILRRIFRIWPLYFLVICFGFFLFPSLPFGQNTVHHFWMFGFFLSNIDEILHGLYDPLNFLTATWSISVEEQFYAFWAILIGFSVVDNIKRFVYFFCLVILFSLVFRWFHIGDDRTLYFHTFSVISDFAVGGILAILFSMNVFKQRIRRISKIQWIILYSIGFASMLLEAKIFQGVFFTFQRLFISMFFAVFIADQLLSNHSFFKVDRLPILAKLGEWTYGIYLFHCIVIFYLEAIFIQNDWISSAYHFLSFIFLVISISIGLSYLSFRWFESPFLRLKNKF